MTNFLIELLFTILITVQCEFIFSFISKISFKYIVSYFFVNNLANVADNQIIGGEISDIKDYPYVASLYVKTRQDKTEVFKCGAVIIGKKWLITAAHCIE